MRSLRPAYCVDDLICSVISDPRRQTPACSSQPTITLDRTAFPHRPTSPLGRACFPPRAQRSHDNHGGSRL